MSEHVAQPRESLRVFLQTAGLDLVRQAVLCGHLWERDEPVPTHATHAEWLAIYQQALTKETPE